MVLGNMVARLPNTEPRAPAPDLVLDLMPPALMVVAIIPTPKPSRCPRSTPMPAVLSGRRPMRPGPVLPLTKRCASPCPPVPIALPLLKQ